MITHFHWKKSVGCSFLTTIADVRCIHSCNLNEKWLHVKVDKLFKKNCNLPFFVSKDANLAGLTEVNLGAAKKRKSSCNCNNHWYRNWFLTLLRRNVNSKFRSWKNVTHR